MRLFSKSYEKSSRLGFHFISSTLRFSSMSFSVSFYFRLHIQSVTKKADILRPERCKKKNRSDRSRQESSFFQPLFRIRSFFQRVFACKIGFDTAENEFSKVCQKVVGQLDRLCQTKRRLMVWDWDDTLFPSTWISCQGLRLEDEAPDPVT